MSLVKEKLFKSTMMLLIALLSGITLLIILFGVGQFKLSSQFAGINQVANLSHVLVRQQANLLSSLIANNANTALLTEHLDNLAKESFVVDASIYANNGDLLAQSSNSGNLREQLGLDRDLDSDNTERNNVPSDTQQVVEPIYSVGGVAGFLRVTFDAKYGQTAQSKINQIFHKLYGEFIIVFLVGILLASSVHYFLSHYRRIKRKNVETKKIKPLKLTNSQTFHRRRRRI